MAGTRRKIADEIEAEMVNAPKPEAQARAPQEDPVPTPLWYKLLSASIIALLFLAVGFVFGGSPAGSKARLFGAICIVLGIGGNIALPKALAHATGAKFDRYSHLSTTAIATLIGLLLLGIIPQMTGLWPWSMFVAAALAFVAVIVYERHLDAGATRA